jgi:hypothetical protein
VVNQRDPGRPGHGKALTQRLAAGSGLTMISGW